MSRIKTGIIGLGKRGYNLLRDVVLNMEDVAVTAICDVYEDRLEKVANLVCEKKGVRPIQTTNPYELMAFDEVECVLVLSAWETHIPFAIAAMEVGKPVGMEAGGAYTIEQCWDLVKAHERTKTPVMLLENCCYGRKELLVLNMVQKGLLGEIVHCTGGYHHDLRKEVSFGAENRHYRLRNYLNRDCENYPTHELGPIARILKLNHGNRMVSLVSVSSKAAGLKEYINREKSYDDMLMSAEFKQGDIVTTVIRCAGGETITLTLDTTLPRYYSRGLTVRGTKGMYEEVTDSVFIDGKGLEDYDFRWGEQYGNSKEYREEYEHPIWRDYLKSGVKGGHEGMDWLVLSDYFECVRTKKPFPIDVYDAATWMSITPLSEKSVALGGVPVEIPDFTNGQWLLPVSK